jgi:hypothetical protein
MFTVLSVVTLLWFMHEDEESYVVTCRNVIRRFIQIDGHVGERFSASGWRT